MAALLDQWLSLLDQIAADPAKPIDQFSLVTPSAQACVPDPSARLDESWLAPIHSLIARQAEKAPKKVAVIGADESWTYRELDDASNRLAGLLSRKNIHPGDVVAIYAHRDPTLAVAILAARYPRDATERAQSQAREFLRRHRNPARGRLFHDKRNVLGEWSGRETDSSSRQGH